MTNMILAAMHETANDLHKIGLINIHKMRKLDALCLEPIHAYSGAQVKSSAPYTNLAKPS